MKIVVAALVALAAMAGSAHAQEAEKGTFGIGLILGEPTGVSAKLYLDDTHAIDAALGSGFIGGALQVHADYLWHPWILEQRDSFTMPVYVGPGAEFSYYSNGRQSGYASVGVRGEIGILFDFTELPIDVFVEVAPGAEWHLTSDSEHSGFHLNINAGAGARYYF